MVPFIKLLFTLLEKGSWDDAEALAQFVLYYFIGSVIVLVFLGYLLKIDFDEKQKNKMNCRFSAELFPAKPIFSQEK